VILPGFEWNSRTGEHMNLFSFDRRLLTSCTTRWDQMPLLKKLAKKPVTVVLHTDHGLGQGIFLRFINPNAKAHRRAPVFPASVAGLG
jgi:hypothetical protein